MASTKLKTDGYLAGLWAGDLATGLRGASGSDLGKSRLPPEQENFNSRDFSSPSWFWLAVSRHHIIFQTLMFGLSMEIQRNPRDNYACGWQGLPYVPKSLPAQVGLSARLTEINMLHVELKSPDSPYVWRSFSGAV